ncbi:phosphatidate cytidylyltransferase [Desulfosarcina sp. OttesenSCG-928-A07]|nr:phosphatidate cytidylyltransferase [Desulfosarcina sp. OttesenSCG-928-G17]MDL2328555.1 phosphatidate cytidylyltransferase [Desulfosarcina sp. OttesenSCG-928-A07]
MHLKRWITGIIAVPLVYLLVDTGGWAFLLLIVAVSLLTFWEYGRMTLANPPSPLKSFIFGVGMVFSAVMGVSVNCWGMAGIPLVLAVNLVVSAGVSLPLFKTDTKAPFIVTRQMAGLVYIPMLLSFLVLLRADVNGALWVFLLLCTVAAGDIGAFYTGTYLGRHKLCPWVSPKKTIEGSLGGLLSNVVLVLAFKALFFPLLPLLPGIVFALLIGVSGQIGDLFASEFKRSVGIKDSGRLLPGHGGFLDRLDALLLASPIAYLLKISIF